jgi:hypothetical protein
MVLTNVLLVKFVGVALLDPALKAGVPLNAPEDGQRCRAGRL